MKRTRIFRTASFAGILGGFLGALSAMPASAEHGYRMTEHPATAALSHSAADQASTRPDQPDRHGTTAHPLRGDFPHAAGVPAPQPPQAAKVVPRRPPSGARQTALRNPLRGEFPEAGAVPLVTDLARQEIAGTKDR